MMKKYLIAGLKIAFSFEYEEYFKNNIEKYETKDSEEVDCVIISKTVDKIAGDFGKLVYEYKNRSVFENSDWKSLVVYDEFNEKKLLMRHRHDFSEYEIFMTRVYQESLAEMEYVYSGVAFMEIAIKNKRLALHASAINVNNKAILFSAASGTGKTTHVNNWKTIGIDFKIINDDKPLLYKKDDLYYVAGTPWSGKERLNSNEDIPLYAIIFLKRGIENKIVNLEKKAKLNELLKNCHRPGEIETYDNVLNIVEEVIDRTIIFEFKATKESDSALFLYDILF